MGSRRWEEKLGAMILAMGILDVSTELTQAGFQAAGFAPSAGVSGRLVVLGVGSWALPVSSVLLCALGTGSHLHCGGGGLGCRSHSGSGHGWGQGAGDVSLWLPLPLCTLGFLQVLVPCLPWAAGGRSPSPIAWAHCSRGRAVSALLCSAFRSFAKASRGWR